MALKLQEKLKELNKQKELFYEDEVESFVCKKIVRTELVIQHNRENNQHYELLPKQHVTPQKKQQTHYVTIPNSTKKESSTPQSQIHVKEMTEKFEKFLCLHQPAEDKQTNTPENSREIRRKRADLFSESDVENIFRLDEQTRSLSVGQLKQYNEPEAIKQESNFGIQQLTPSSDSRSSLSSSNINVKKMAQKFENILTFQQPVDDDDSPSTRKTPEIETNLSNRNIQQHKLSPSVIELDSNVFLSPTTLPSSLPLAEYLPLHRCENSSHIISQQSFNQKMDIDNQTSTPKRDKQEDELQCQSTLENEAQTKDLEHTLEVCGDRRGLVQKNNEEQINSTPIMDMDISEQVTLLAPNRHQHSTEIQPYNNIANQNFAVTNGVYINMMTHYKNENDTAAFKVTNLDDDMFADFDYELKHQKLHRQISTRSISDPTLNKISYSPVKPPRLYHRNDDSTDELNESQLVYSLTDYRLNNAEKKKIQRKHNGIATHLPAQQLRPMSTQNSTASLTATTIMEDNEKRLAKKWLVIDELQRLAELSKRETSILQQTSLALQCCTNDPHTALSDKKIECERVIFIARQKLTAYNSEIKRLENCDPDMEYYSPELSRSTLVIQDIRLMIKEDYIRSLRKGTETKFYYIMYLMKYRSQILFSHMFSSLDTLQLNGQIIFSNRMMIREVDSNFVATIGVYCMEITMKHPIMGLDHSAITAAANGATINHTCFPLNDCRHCDRQSLNTTVAIPGQHTKNNTMIRVSSFFQVDAITIRKEHLKCNEFHLSISAASIPLKNKLYVKIQRLSEFNVRKCGYLTIYSDVSGSGIWLRRWFVLTNEHKLKYWSSPEDEDHVAAEEIDLFYCIDHSVNILQRETCARPHTFELRIALPTKKSSNNSLITTNNPPSNSIISQPFGKRTLYRYWLSADSKEDRNDWCRAINDLLEDLKEWESDTQEK
ncbi:unnamed protein product [Didymodactylos carnosus]|uniref:PH domain-containing protein n=1 Tax=Didymodactylos carnosus TaxID=1234261 RepID=A0A813Z8K5_9BILA|nr:unnamed protein product [Didymodactylos carnosus]CAF0894970.1 unnamed protein product [Didymodactylos carnosus]CAF3668897.1 unnamed protein product [Didymodactylos carnosus]CAF3678567.1 unnamed protein product [Didymodactylos carnosus]